MTDTPPQTLDVEAIERRTDDDKMCALDHDSNLVELMRHSIIDRYALLEALRDSREEIARLREALEPFAKIFKRLGPVMELDRDARITASIHANGPGASGWLGTIDHEDLRSAAKALEGR